MIIDPYTWHQLKVTAISSVSADTVMVSMKRPRGFAFRAGQYAVVRISNEAGNQYIRQYSFASGPNQKDLELLIQKEPTGEVSNWFHKHAKPGNIIELSQALGSFSIDKMSTKRPVLFIAARVGIAPFISMLRDTRRKNITILYSVRDEQQVCFPDFLAKFATTIVNTKESPRISHDFLKNYLKPESAVYICGSKQFVDNMSEAIENLGVSPENIRRELFTLQ